MIREDGGRLYVSGPITLRTAMTLLDAMAGHIGSESKVVDFSSVSDVDSSAVSLMLEWSRRARAAGGSNTLYVEKAYQSTSSARTSTRRWGANATPSTTTWAPTA